MLSARKSSSSPFHSDLPDMATRLLEAVADWKTNLAPSTNNGALICLALDFFDQMQSELQRPTRIVILGEMNSGKTSLANLLSRSRVLDTSALANTHRSVILHAINTPIDSKCLRLRGRRMKSADRNYSVMDSVERIGIMDRPGLLESCIIIDTPGSSNPLASDGADAWYAEQADVAIWCSVASQCWKESERSTWDSYPLRLRSRSVLVLTGADNVTSAADRLRISKRLTRDAGKYFPAIALLSTPEAFSALDVKTGTVVDAQQWSASGASRLENTISLLARRVADERRRQWERRVFWLLRRLEAASQNVDTGRLWCLPFVTKWFGHLRQIDAESRARQADLGGLTEQARAATQLLKDHLVTPLNRLGRQRDAEALTQMIDHAMDRFSVPTVLFSSRREFANLASELFHGIGRLLQPSQQEFTALLDLRLRLSAICGRTRNGQVPTQPPEPPSKLPFATKQDPLRFIRLRGTASKIGAHTSLCH